MENSKELQKQYQEYREKVYGEYPEVGRFWKNKKRVIGFLLIYCLVPLNSLNAAGLLTVSNPCRFPLYYA